MSKQWAEERAATDQGYRKALADLVTAYGDWRKGTPHEWRAGPGTMPYNVPEGTSAEVAWEQYSRLKIGLKEQQQLYTVALGRYQTRNREIEIREEKRIDLDGTELPPRDRKSESRGVLDTTGDDVDFSGRLPQQVQDDIAAGWNASETDDAASALVTG